jgi:hypothetical protein
MKKQNNHVKDRRVLSVPAGISYAHMTEHNVYSCPETYPQHDIEAEAFAPRDEEGKIPRLYCIMARVTTNPNNPAFPQNLKSEYAQSVISYIGAVRHLSGILDGNGKYRFYILGDLENGALKHSPTVNAGRAAHIYLSLKDLISGCSRVSPID